MILSSTYATSVGFLRFAAELTDASRALIRSRFRAEGNVEMAPDDTPVTPTDLVEASCAA